MIIHIRHARQLGYCSKGLRVFCKKYNLNYIQFATVGVDINQLKHINDSYLDNVINQAKRELDGQ